MTEKERIIEKIQKLMALSSSSNEHEAAAAAAKAQELLFKYNLDMAEVAKEENEEIHKFDYLEKDNSSWRQQLMAGICRATSCQMVIQSLRYKKHTNYYVLGKPETIEIVVYLYEHLARELNKISPRPLSSPNSHAFRVGAVQTISIRLFETYKEFQKASDNTMALVLATEALVEAKKKEIFPDLRDGRAGRIGDYSGYREGREAGKNVPINKGLTNNRNHGGQLLLK